MKTQIPLSQLQTGESCKIIRLDHVGIMRCRLMELGFAPDSILTRLTESIWGDPIAYGVKGTVIALRRCDAEKILVVPL